jgi:hypothetical protein
VIKTSLKLTFALEMSESGALVMAHRDKVIKKLPGQPVSCVAAKSCYDVPAAKYWVSNDCGY